MDYIIEECAPKQNKLREGYRCNKILIACNCGKCSQTFTGPEHLQDSEIRVIACFNFGQILWMKEPWLCVVIFSCRNVKRVPFLQSRIDVCEMCEHVLRMLYKQRLCSI